MPKDSKMCYTSTFIIYNHLSSFYNAFIIMYHHLSTSFYRERLIKMSKMWEIHQELLRGASFSPLRRVTPRHAASRRRPIAASPARTAAGGAGRPSHVPDLVAAVSENLRDKWSQVEPRGAKRSQVARAKWQQTKDI